MIRIYDSEKSATEKIKKVVDFYFYFGILFLARLRNQQSNAEVSELADEQD